MDDVDGLTQSCMQIAMVVEIGVCISAAVVMVRAMEDTTEVLKL